MVQLEADNRKLLDGAKYTFLSTNYPSGTGVVNALNITDSSFAVGAVLLFDLFGTESAEIRTITSVNSTTGDITLSSATTFAHAESSRVTILNYSQVRFFWTSSTTFDMATPLTGYSPIQPDDWFTTYGDEGHSTGYGWYIFYNPVTLIASQPSNYIPYVGFERDTIEDILADFFSLLNNNELKLITRRDALSWLNEGYSIIRNKLNLTNVEYTSSEVQTLTTVANTIEYALPYDFDHLLSLIGGVDSTNPGAGGNLARKDIEFIPLRAAYTYNGSEPRYYLRGSYIGILPTPSSAITYTYLYLKKADKLSLNSDQVVLPNNGAYAVKDWMLYRAYLKYTNPIYATYLKAFNDNMNQLIVSSVKRDANLDSWSIDRSANV